MVEGGRLESVWAATSRGFESLLLRQKLQGPGVGALSLLSPAGEDRPKSAGDILDTSKRSPAGVPDPRDGRS